LSLVVFSDGAPMWNIEDKTASEPRFKQLNLWASLTFAA
jgi:hypothetical protein